MPGLNSVCFPVKHVFLAKLSCNTHWPREARRSYMVSTSVKGLKFHLTFQAYKLAFDFSWILAKDTRCMGQRQPSLSVTTSKVYAFCWFVSVPHTPQVPWGDMGGPRWMPSHTLNLGDPIPLEQVEATCSLRQGLSHLSSCLVQTQSREMSQEKIIQGLEFMTYPARRPRAHGRLLPNISSRLFKLQIIEIQLKFV